MLTHPTLDNLRALKLDGMAEAFADAILDRLVHNAYRLELEGQSFRKKTAKMDDEKNGN